MTTTVSTTVQTSAAERQRRIAAVRAAMKRDGLEALVVCGRDDIRYRGRTFYVSDVWQLLADTHVIITLDDGPIFVGGQVFGLGQAESQSDWPTEFLVSGKPGEEIAAALRQRGLDRAAIVLVGLYDASFAVQHYNEIRDGLPEADLRDATSLFESVRHANSPDEIAKLNETSATFREIYRVLADEVKPGITERQLAAQAHRASREHGLRDPMVLMFSSPYGALSFGTDKVIGPDDIVTLWIESAGPNGFWLEYRQCYSFGPAPQEYRDYFDLQKEALAAGLDALRPGNRAGDFVSAVQGVLEGQGYTLGYADPTDPHSTFSLHGIGSDAIQGVWVPGQDRELAQDEVVNIHPSVKFKSDAEAAKFGWFGVTDNVRVTPGGGVWMTHTDGLPNGFVEL